MFLRKTLSFAGLCVALVAPDLSLAQEAVHYQLPAKSIADLVDAPMIPKVELNADQSWMLILNAPRYVDMDLAAYPLLGLGGLRVNPNTYTLEGENHGFFDGIEVKNLKKNQENVVIQGLPKNLKMSNIRWSPNGQSFAFTNRTSTGLELWYIDLQLAVAKPLFQQSLNALIGDLLAWHPSGDYLMALVPSRTISQLPIKQRIPTGPVVQENLGKANSSRTYQNLLTDQHDEDLFDHYLESQLTQVYLDGRIVKVGQPAIFKKNEFSPDGSYVLVETIHKPYSYQVPLNFFPTSTAIWTSSGHPVKTLVEARSTENSTGSDANTSNARNYHWRVDKGADMAWVKALEKEAGSEGRAEAGDGIYTLSAPFTGEATLIFKTSTRFSSITWGNSAYAVVKESLRRTRAIKSTLINPETGAIIKVIEDRSSEDTYSDPGNFVLKDGKMLLTGKNSPVAFTIGNGASPQGDRPFLLRWDLMKNVKDTLFKSNASLFEMPIAYDGDKNLYISRESGEVPANTIHVILGSKKNKEIALTHFESPYTGLQGVQKKLITYTRKDGLKLTGTLYLPKGFEPNISERLPVLVWAYPREYKSAELASQIKGSPHRFAELNFRSPVYWVTRGYAIVENADMPIVGEDKVEPNDTFIEQIEWNSAALIDYLVGEGIADRDRFGVGGHSYGAFMTANLLAHTDLFAAGIARSGAYNRTLTPFGFQSETRTYWKAKDVYDRMSPFTYADKIKLPLLITHGMDDENSGTFPVQSERLYAAIKGHGGTTRLVMFPYEFHGFRARESIMHVFWEQDQWLEKYVKNRVIKKEDK